jgi:hypothetical protein
VPTGVSDPVDHMYNDIILHRKRQYAYHIVMMYLGKPFMEDLLASVLMT